MTEQKTAIEVRDYLGRPINSNAFYASDSLCYPQSRTEEERLIARSRTTEDTLYHVTYANDLRIDATNLAGVAPVQFSFRGEEAAEFASKLRPISIEVVKEIAERLGKRAQSLDKVVYQALLTDNKRFLRLLKRTG